jgi:hypothetical protein
MVAIPTFRDAQCAACALKKAARCSHGESFDQPTPAQQLYVMYQVVASRNLSQPILLDRRRQLTYRTRITVAEHASKRFLGIIAISSADSPKRN